MGPAKLLFVVLAVSVFIGAKALTCLQGGNPKECKAACMYLLIADTIVTGCNTPRDDKYLNKGCIKYRDMKAMYCDKDNCNEDTSCDTFTSAESSASPSAVSPSKTLHCIIGSNGPQKCGAAGLACFYIKISKLILASCGSPRDDKYLNKGCIKFPDMFAMYCDTDNCNDGEPCATFTSAESFASPPSNIPIPPSGLAPGPDSAPPSGPGPKSSVNLVQPTFLLLALLFVLF